MTSEFLALVLLPNREGFHERYLAAGEREPSRQGNSDHAATDDYCF